MAGVGSKEEILKNIGLLREYQDKLIELCAPTMVLSGLTSAKVCVLSMSKILDRLEFDLQQSKGVRYGFAARSSEREATA